MENERDEKARKLHISGKEHGLLGNVGSAVSVYPSERRLHRTGAFACLLAWLPAALAAQTPDDINAKFQAMEQRIKSLESEVSALKAALSAQPAEAPAPATPQAAPQ